MISYVVDRGGATIFKVGVYHFARFAREKFFNFCTCHLILVFLEDKSITSESQLSLQSKIIYVHLYMLIYHVQRVSAIHGVKDDFAFLWEHAIFRHPPNKNPLTDRSEILHSSLSRRDH
jgi:hypothetical protein